MTTRVAPPSTTHPRPAPAPGGRRLRGRARSPLAWLLLGLVRLYQVTASARAPRCRYAPTCSSYALEAVRRHGGVRGGWLAIGRVLRCHPWRPGGVDPVPPPRRDGDRTARPSRPAPGSSRP